MPAQARSRLVREQALWVALEDECKNAARLDRFADALEVIGPVVQAVPTLSAIVMLDRAFMVARNNHGS